MFSQGSVQTEKEYNGFHLAAEQCFTALLAAAFPRHHGLSGQTDPAFYRAQAISVLHRALAFTQQDPQTLTDAFMAQLDAIIFDLNADAQAAYDNDPAATSLDDVILLYPAFRAICAYRFSHALYELGAKMLARAVSEVVHRDTNIDIHPGAKIGRGLFIDHGGVIIGETATVGENCILFSNVVLGVKSFERDETGKPKKGVKRHPDIGNHVTIYTGACVLGGATHVGDGSVIGARVWLTHSVGENETITAVNAKSPKQKEQ